MTWDVARRMGARIRVALLDAHEYIGMARALSKASPLGETKTRKAVRAADLVQERGYSVYSDGPDTILEVGNFKLRMSPEVARDISAWLCETGYNVQLEYAPDMIFTFHVAHLSDAGAKELEQQGRRDATVAGVL